MKNITWKKTSALRPVEHGLVDYIATGFMLRDKEEIPCEIGYLEYYDSFGNQWIEPTHIFIQEGVLKSGLTYFTETIEI